MDYTNVKECLCMILKVWRKNEYYYAKVYLFNYEQMIGKTLE